MAAEDHCCLDDGEEATRMHLGIAVMGEEDSVGGFGFRTRNREGRELIELVMKNWLAVKGTFFKKRENHKISYRSGHNKIEIDLLEVR